MYLQIFRPIVLLATIVFITNSVIAQGKFLGDANELNRVTTFTKIPDIVVADKRGTSSKLTDFIKNNQLHAGKPYLIAGFGYYGNYSLSDLNELASKNLGDQYNVVILCIGANESEMTNTTLTKSGYDSKWDKFMVVKTTWASIEPYFKQWPFTVFADKNQQIVAAIPDKSHSYEKAKAILDGIQAGKIRAGKLWYTKEGDLVSPDAETAYFYEEYKIEGNKIAQTQGTKAKVLYRAAFVRSGKDYYYDGIHESFTAEGQKTFEGQFKDGVPTAAVKSWFKDGKTRSNFPVNGVAKGFDEGGKLVFEGPIQNGLGNGTFISYKDGDKMQQLNYKNGELSGLQTIYKYGEVENEFFVSPEYSSYGYLSEGLQKVEIKGAWGYVDRTGKVVIAPQFEESSINDFEGGVASVKKNGKYVTIDRNGKVISEDEAKKIKANWKQDVKVYKTKAAILAFLNENFVKKLYYERFKNDTKIESLDPRLKFEIPLVAADYDVPYSDIAGIRAKEYNGKWYIEFLGKIAEEGESFLRTDQDIFLDYSVSSKLAHQVAANLRQLATMNGATLLVDDMKNMSQSDLFAVVDKAVGAAKGFSATRDGKIAMASFSKDRSVCRFENNARETRSGFDWSSLDKFYYEKVKESALTRISIWFYEKAKFTEEDENNKKRTTHFFSIYVPNDHALKAIAALHLIKESFAK